MNNYLIKICSVTLFALFAYPLNIANAQSDRNPFSPSGGNVIKAKSVTVDEDDLSDRSNPLTTSRISSYKIIGTIVSDKKKYATIKSLSGVDYVVKPGDKLGSEGGNIKDITDKGVKVDVNGNVSTLPVSNKIEVKGEE